MNFRNFLARARGLVFIGMAAATLLGGQAVNAQARSKPADAPAPGLKWSLMPMIAFDYGPGKYKGTPDKSKLLGTIWADVLKSIPYIDSDGRKFPSFVIYSEPIDLGDSTVVFTSLSAARAAYGKCEDSVNPDLFSICPMVMVKQNKATCKATRTEFNNFCHLYYEDPPAQTVEGNHVQMAFDASKGRAYFKVIQYGKHVPSCDRVVSVR